MRSSRADDDVQRLRKTLARDVVRRMSVNSVGINGIISEGSSTTDGKISVVGSF